MRFVQAGSRRCALRRGRPQSAWRRGVLVRRGGPDAEKGMSALEDLLAAIKRKDASAVTRGAVLDVFEAAAAGDADRVRTLLDANGSLRDAHAPDGWTPLHLAGHFRQRAVIDRLLARGADGNPVSHNADANAPLHPAVA